MVMLLIAIPGLYFMVGRFLVNAWKKRHVWYAVTDRHELLLHRGKEPPTRDSFDSFPAFEPHDVIYTLEWVFRECEQAGYALQLKIN
jgi:hypothetical protein